MGEKKIKFKKVCLVTFSSLMFIVMGFLCYSNYKLNSELELLGKKVDRCSKDVSDLEDDVRYLESDVSVMDEIIEHHLLFHD